jgi:hypothetical protein
MLNGETSRWANSRTTMSGVVALAGISAGKEKATYRTRNQLVGSNRNGQQDFLEVANTVCRVACLLSSSACKITISAFNLFIHLIPSLLTLSFSLTACK